MNDKSRFDKFKDKFKPDAQKKPLKSAHLGDTLVMDLTASVKRRLDQIIPFFCDRASIDIKCSSTSFWEKPKKFIVLTIFIEFDETTVWKDQQIEDTINNN